MKSPFVMVVLVGGLASFSGLAQPAPAPGVPTSPAVLPGKGLGQDEEQDLMR